MSSGLLLEVAQSPMEVGVVLTPLFAADQPQAPPELRTALHTIDRHIDQRFAHARLPHRSLKLGSTV